MNCQWLDQYCTSMQWTKKEYKEEWDATRYMVAEKMFAMTGKDNTGRPIITLKLLPDEGDFLRHQFDYIVAVYYMNKVHWNTVYLDGSVPEDVLKDMIVKSHSIVFSSLPKKIRTKIQR